MSVPQTNSRQTTNHINFVVLAFFVLDMTVTAVACSRRYDCVNVTHHNVGCTCVQRPERSAPARDGRLSWESCHRFHLCR